MLRIFFIEQIAQSNQLMLLSGERNSDEVHFLFEPKIDNVNFIPGSNCW